MRITSSWTCEEAEVRDSRQQAQGFDSERCTSCRWCPHGPCGPPRKAVTDCQCVGEMIFCVHEPQYAARDPSFGYDI